MKTFVIGAGGWGTALALTLQSNHHDVALWEFDKAYADQMRESCKNSRFLPGVELPEAVEIVTDFNKLGKADLVVLVAPSAHVRATIERAHSEFRKEQTLVIASKGVERHTLLTMSQVVEAALKETGGQVPALVTLSGPSHAEEVSRQVPTTVVAGSHDGQAAKIVQRAFNNQSFRVYTSGDHLGVELAGSLKNVVAVAAGIADGLGLGDNTKAALMTRGLAEMSRLGVAMGAKAATFGGLAGMGDLVVTCMSRHSRNRSVGERLGKGETLEAIDQSMDMVAEGVVTAESALGLSKKFKIEMPICAAVGAILFDGKDPKEALIELMSRDVKAE